MNELIFKISELEFIKVVTDHNIDFKKINYSCGEVKAYFLNDNENSLCIGQESIGLFFEALIGVLKKALNSKALTPG